MRAGMRRIGVAGRGGSVRREGEIGQGRAALRQREQAEIRRRAGQRLLGGIAGDALQHEAGRAVEAVDGLAQPRRRRAEGVRRPP